jgi:putative tryptophan/tyrosine transport system substrate-binding protein
MIRILALVFALLLPLAPFEDARAQSTERKFRIYAITFRGMTNVEKGFQDYFAARKIPVEITFRDLNRDNTRLPGFLEEIRRTKPDLVYTWGTSVTLGVVGALDKIDPKTHVTATPVVFTMVAAPVLAKIVPNLKSSGRNVTGVYHVAPTETQMRAIASFRPFRKLGVLYSPTERNSVVTLDEITKFGKTLGYTVIDKKFRLDAAGKLTAEGAAEMIAEMKAAGAEWLYLPPDSFLGLQAQKVVIPAAMENGLPTFASTEQLMEAGALSGLISRYHSIGQFTAYKVEQILMGRKSPDSIPIETLARFSFQVQLDSAIKLGMPPPLPMFNYAEFVTPPEPPAN